MSIFGTRASGKAFAMVCDQMKSNVMVGEIMNDGGTVNRAAIKKKKERKNIYQKRAQLNFSNNSSHAMKERNEQRKRYQQSFLHQIQRP